MTKAEISLKNGTKIKVEGTPEEIINLKNLLEPKNEESINVGKKSKIRIFSKQGPLSRIRELIVLDFFKEKRILKDVKKVLENKAIFYKPSDLSPSLIRLVKNGELRRMKENKQWRYFNP